MDKVSIVIPVYNNLALTINCLTDLSKTYGVAFEVIVINDGSRDATAVTLPKLFPDVKLLHNETNQGFAATINKGIAAASGNFILMLNNDIRLPKPGWLLELLAQLKSRNLDLVAPAGGRLTKDFDYLPGEATRSADSFSYLVGWALLAKKEVFDKIGLIPTCFPRGFWEDTLWGLRAKKAGFKAGIVENTGIQHLYHATFKAENINISEQYKNNRKIFLDLAKQEGLKA